MPECVRHTFIFVYYRFKGCFHCVALANIVVIVYESILTLRDMVAYAILGKKQ